MEDGRGKRFPRKKEIFPKEKNPTPTRPVFTMCTTIGVKRSHMEHLGFTLKNGDDVVVIRPGMRVPVLKLDWEKLREDVAVPALKPHLYTWGVLGFNVGDIIPNARDDKAFAALRLGRGFWAGSEPCFVPLSSFEERGYKFYSPSDEVLYWLALIKGDRVAGVTTEAMDPIVRVAPRMPLLHTFVPGYNGGEDYLLKLFTPSIIELAVDGEIDLGQKQMTLEV